jgi:hypothetical protein
MKEKLLKLEQEIAALKTAGLVVRTLNRLSRLEELS